VRLREDHLRARTPASMKLGALLEAHWPGPKAVFYRLASPIALAFLADYPTPPGRRPPRRGPHGQPAAAATATAAASHRRRCWPGCARPRPLRSASRRPPWPLLSVPRSSCCAPCLGPSPSSRRPSPPVSLAIHAPSCWPRCPGRHHQPGPAAGRGRADPGPRPRAEHAAAECGAAPVTKASGKTSGVYFRWAANRRARKALTAFAHNSRLASPWAGRLYADARARGKRNPTPPASSPVPGSGSSGPAGSKPPPTTPPCTPPLSELPHPNLTQETETGRCPTALQAP
jgi:Transposase IS116/IS110/IS902 family